MKATEQYFPDGCAVQGCLLNYTGSPLIQSTSGRENVAAQKMVGITRWSKGGIPLNQALKSSHVLRFLAFYAPPTLPSPPPQFLPPLKNRIIEIPILEFLWGNKPNIPYVPHYQPIPLHYTLLWPLAVPAEAKQNRRLWHKWAKQKQRLLSNLKQHSFKALLHSTSFLSTWLAILLRHKLHDSLPSITCSEMKLSRNLFLTITIARSRPTLSNWQWRLLTPQSFAERWRHVTWVTWDDIQRLFYTCKILQLIEKLATCWLGKNCTENRLLLHTTRHQFCAQHYSINYFCSVQIQTSTMFRAKTHRCYSSHEALS